ncbi:MAG: peptide chain release factor 2 [Syntrophales bacterium]|nr:peptide chain release factor 2 [Syntrophales bacterium]
MIDGWTEKVEDLKKRIDHLKVCLDIPAKESEITAIEKEASQPEFWNEPQKAGELLKKKAESEEMVTRWKSYLNMLNELEMMYELALTENDFSILADIERELTKLQLDIRKEEIKLMLGAEEDALNAILSINAGAGGTEAQDWAEMLLRMYLRWAERKGYKTTIIDLQPGEEAGIKSASITLEGEYAYGFAKAEIGIHRLVRISPFDSNARRHTSFASVFVYPEVKDDIVIEIDEKDLRIDTFRSSGAGGQHVNKTDSAVRITHIPTGIVVQCQNERSQHKNRAMAMKYLRSRLYELKLKEKREKLMEIEKTKKDIAWGSQIRSYILHPYKLVKDHRTNLEVGDVNRVLDGDLDEFIEAYLLMQHS